MQQADANTPSMDWRHGIWNASHSPVADAEIMIAGDWAPIRNFSDIMLETPEAIYGNLLPVLSDCDLRLVNLECPLVDEGIPVTKSGAVLKGVSGHVSALTRVPFEIVTLGNNHVFDYGVDGFVRTRSLLEHHGIQSTGAGMTVGEAGTPVMITVKGVTIAVISFAEGEDLTAAAGSTPGVLGWEIQRVTDLIRKIRTQAHVVVVVCHGGVEYIPYPPPYLAQALQRIAEGGADLIIGHHPHVPQGIQIHNNVPICYSLGNFVFFQPTHLLYRKIGYLVKAGVSTAGLSTIRLIPYEILSDRLSMLSGQRLAKALDKLAALSKPFLGKDGIQHAWHGFLKYYGVRGFKTEIIGILDRLDRDASKGAAMFRNRLTTLQHSHHLVDLMTRIMNRTLDDAPEWAVAAVAEYFSRNVADGLPEQPWT